MASYAKELSWIVDFNADVSDLNAYNYLTFFTAPCEHDSSSFFLYVFGQTNLGQGFEKRVKIFKVHKKAEVV